MPALYAIMFYFFSGKVIMDTFIQPTHFVKLLRIDNERQQLSIQHLDEARRHARQKYHEKYKLDMNTATYYIDSGQLSPIANETQYLAECRYNLACRLARENYLKVQTENFSTYSEKYRAFAAERDSLAPAAHSESYKVFAQQIGFDDYDNGESNDIHVAIKPILSSLDLRQSLMLAAISGVDSQIIDIFYDVRLDDSLHQAVHSLDLARNSVIFQHQCCFMSPPLLPDKNTLYIEGLAGRMMTFTILSPGGTLLSNSYHIHEIYDKMSLNDLHYMTVKDFLTKNSHVFVMDMNDKHRPYSSCLNAFSELIASTTGFKEHIIRTIMVYNQSVIAESGLKSALLTKTHIFRSIGFSVGEFTPSSLCILNKQIKRSLSGIRVEYETQESRAKDDLKLAIELASKKRIREHNSKVRILPTILEEATAEDDSCDADMCIIMRNYS